MKKQLIELWQELKVHVQTGIKLWFEAMKLRLAIWLADIKQRARNRRFHVVFMTVGINKQGEPITRLRSIDNEGFKWCKRQGWLPKRMTFLELERKAFYSTDLNRNNAQTREERKRAMDKYMRYQQIVFRN